MNRALKKCGVPTCQLEKMDSIAELWRAMERIYIGPGGGGGTPHLNRVSRKTAIKHVISIRHNQPETVKKPHELAKAVHLTASNSWC